MNETEPRHGGEGRESAAAPSFTARLASRSPTPGGGAAAARTGAHAAALAVKVLRISRRRADAATARQLERLEEQAAPLIERFGELEESDQQAFRALLKALRRVRKESTDDGDVETASRRATEVPLETMEASLQLSAVLEEITDLAARGKVRAEADVGAAADLCAAAFRSSTWNVRANLPQLASEATRQAYRKRWQDLDARFEKRYEELRRAVRGRMPG